MRAVILVTCESLRADHLGTSGYERPTSPNIDAFAADSTVFVNAWTTATSTAPAIASLLSGRLPDEIAMSAGDGALLPPEVETFPEILSREGIFAAAIVSSQVLSRPALGRADAGVHRGFATFDDGRKTKGSESDTPERSSRDTTDAAIAWLSGRRDRRSTPFFLWVHYHDPRGGTAVPARLASIFERPSADSDRVLPLGRTASGKGQIPAHQAMEGEARPGRYRDRYDAEVRFFDEGLGRLLAWLKENGMYERSLIVLVADHGESLGEHGFWFCHGENVYAEEARVPLVVHAPSGPDSSRGPRGSQRRDVASLLDLGSTVLDAFGLAPFPGRGRSLLAPPPAEERVAVTTAGIPGTSERWTAVAGERFRLISRPGSEPQLFDLLEDPLESLDRSATIPEGLRDLIARRSAVLAGDARPKVARGILRAGADLDESTRAALRRLGYVDGE